MNPYWYPISSGGLACDVYGIPTTLRSPYCSRSTPWWDWGTAAQVADTVTGTRNHKNAIRYCDAQGFENEPQASRLPSVPLADYFQQGMPGIGLHENKYRAASYAHEIASKTGTFEDKNGSIDEPDEEEYIWFKLPEEVWGTSLHPQDILTNISKSFNITPDPERKPFNLTPPKEQQPIKLIPPKVHKSFSMNPATQYQSQEWHMSTPWLAVNSNPDSESFFENSALMHFNDSALIAAQGGLSSPYSLGPYITNHCPHPPKNGSPPAVLQLNKEVFYNRTAPLGYPHTTQTLTKVLRDSLGIKKNPNVEECGYENLRYNKGRCNELNSSESELSKNPESLRQARKVICSDSSCNTTLKENSRLNQSVEIGPPSKHDISPRCHLMHSITAQHLKQSYSRCFDENDSNRGKVGCGKVNTPDIGSTKVDFSCMGKAYSMQFSSKTPGYPCKNIQSGDKAQQIVEQGHSKYDSCLHTYAAGLECHEFLDTKTNQTGHTSTGNSYSIKRQPQIMPNWTGKASKENESCNYSQGFPASFGNTPAAEAGIKCLDLLSEAVAPANASPREMPPLSEDEHGVKNDTMNLSNAVSAHAKQCETQQETGKVQENSGADIHHEKKSDSLYEVEQGFEKESASNKQGKRAEVPSSEPNYSQLTIERKGQNWIDISNIIDAFSRERLSPYSIEDNTMGSKIPESMRNVKKKENNPQDKNANAAEGSKDDSNSTALSERVVAQSEQVEDNGQIQPACKSHSSYHKPAEKEKDAGCDALAGQQGNSADIEQPSSHDNSIKALARHEPESKSYASSCYAAYIPPSIATCQQKEDTEDTNVSKKGNKITLKQHIKAANNQSKEGTGACIRSFSRLTQDGKGSLDTAVKASCEGLKGCLPSPAGNPPSESQSSHSGEKCLLPQPDGDEHCGHESMPEKSVGAHIVTKDNKAQFLFNIPCNEIIERSEYRIIGEISKGSFGVVYIAKWRGQQVAIKKARGIMSMEAMRSVIREVNAYRNLHHPLIVKYYGVCLEPSFLGIVTEYLPGGNLLEALGCKSSLQNSATRMKLALQLLTVIQYLHRKKGLVHRDIKTANLILDNWNNVKLCDFGKTRELDADGRVKLEDNGGSPRYMAPECFVEGNYINEKADVWSLGCCLIEIFGGSIPFDGKKNSEDVMRAVLINKELPNIPSWFNPSLRKIISKCFKWDLQQRPSVRQLEEELRQISHKQICTDHGGTQY